MSCAPLLKINNLQVTFSQGRENFAAVRGLSLSLRPCEVLGLVGESGCGKSVTALSILRLLPPGGRIAGGHIVLEGRSLNRLTAGEMQQVRGRQAAMIFQDPAMALNPVRTVGNQFMETLKVRMKLGRREAYARALALLRSLDLPRPEKIMGQYSFQLSGGMRQRVMIALALALDPLLLIADEPTTALDVTVQAQILKEMDSLKKRRDAAILLITHNMGVVAQLADRVAVMYAGTIVEEGPVRSIFHRAAHPYTRALLQAVPRAGGSGRKLRVIEGHPPALSDLPRGCAFAPRCPSAAGICHEKTPPFTGVAGDHGAACFYPLQAERAAGRAFREERAGGW